MDWETVVGSFQIVWSHVLEFLIIAFQFFVDRDWLLVFFTGILALFTIVLAIATRRLWKDGRILRRAYIAVEPAGVHAMWNGNDLIGHVGIKNAGHLPARNVSWFVGIKPSRNGEEPDDSFLSPQAPIAGNIVIAPGTTATLGSAPGAEAQMLYKFCGFKSGVGREKEQPTFLYVWGVVKYHDGFKKGRTTRFCHRYNWINRGRKREPGSESESRSIDAVWARYHEHGNYAT